MLDEAHETARRRLTDERDKLDHLARSLLREETIDRDDLVQILGPYPGMEMEENDGAQTDDTQAQEAWLAPEHQALAQQSKGRSAAADL
jgi:hypothetical protein